MLQCCCGSTAGPRASCLRYGSSQDMQLSSQGLRSHRRQVQVVCKAKGKKLRTKERPIQEVKSVAAPELAPEKPVVIRRTAFRKAKKTDEDRAAEKLEQVEEWRRSKDLRADEVNLALRQRSGKRVLLVDGYNAIMAWPELAELSSLSDRRAALEDRLLVCASMLQHLIVVVYDAMEAGTRRDGLPSALSPSKWLRIQFSSSKSADLTLAEEAEFWASKQGASETIVCSNDRQVQQDCSKPSMHLQAVAVPWLIEQYSLAVKAAGEKGQQKAVQVSAKRAQLCSTLGVTRLEEALQLSERQLRAANLSTEDILEMLADVHL